MHMLAGKFKYLMAFVVVSSVVTYALTSQASQKRNVNSVKEKKGSIDVSNYAAMQISVKGKFKKHDKEFIYLQTDKSRNLVKIKRRFIDNSPSFLSENEIVTAHLPLGSYLMHNYNVKESKAK